MVRPRKIRIVQNEPEVNYFKPRRIPLSDLEKVILKIEELEAIKLKDLNGLNQEACAKKMKISRGTFQRILNSAKKKISDALINGKAIQIKGGNYRIAQKSEYCVCPICGYKEYHIRGIPCSKTKCKKCGSFMRRK